MNNFASQVCYAGLIGGCIGGVINGVTGFFFSRDTSEEYQRRIIVGVIAGAAIAALGGAIAASNSNGAVIGALIGSIFLLGTLSQQATTNVLEIVSEAVSGIACMSLCGYMFL